MSSAGDINVVDTFQSIAPVSSAVLADLDNSGEPVLVTCSGGGRTGSLRIIRTGANIQELGSIAGVDGIRDVFPLTDTDGYVFHPIEELFELNFVTYIDLIHIYYSPSSKRQDS